MTITDIELIIKNYRCFPDSNPLKLTLRPGFVAFVGPNNSGKSTILRFFYEFRTLFQRVNAETKSFFSTPPVNYTNQGDTRQVFHKGNSRPLSITFKNLPSELDDNKLFDLEIIVDRNTLTVDRNIIVGSTTYAMTSGDAKFYENKLNIVNTVNLDLSPTLKLFSDLTNTMYFGAFRNVINSGGQGSYYDINYGTAFVSSWRDMKTGQPAERNELAKKLTEDIRKIFGFKSLEINASSSGNTLQIFIDDKSYTLDEIGSGFAQFIILLANAAIRRPSYILIDEPELNLHPTLQLEFLTALGSYSTKGVWFSTHNVGLARSAGELVYTVIAKEDGNSTVKPLEATPNLAELLGELSYSGYRELGFEKVLLVEGASEIKAVQQFLRMINIDNQILLMPLGGSQIINGTSESTLQELTRIPAQFFVLIDSEKTSGDAPLDSSREGFRGLCHKAGIKCHILERRAFENYLSDAALKQAFSSKYRSLSTYEKLEETDVPWAKSDNWRVARLMNFSDIETTDLGMFLTSLK